MTYEVKVTGEQLKELWAKTEWNNPFDNYYNDSDQMWEFFYLTERCPEVLKDEFPSLSCSNEDANELLNKMSNFWRGVRFDDYVSKHYDEIKEAFNTWWWSQHDVSDYEE